MSDREEPPLMTLILFPFRLIGFLADLVTLLWLILLCGGLIAFFGAFLWLIVTRPRAPLSAFLPRRGHIRMAPVHVSLRDFCT